MVPSCSGLPRLALLTLAAVCSCHAEQLRSAGSAQAGLQVRGGREQAPPPPLPPLLLQSTACTLAGGWCPSHIEGSSVAARQPHSLLTWAANGGNGSAAGAPGKAPHKPLLPLSWWDIAGVSAAGFALLLAASGGIGGGAILVPLYLMVLGFSTSGAVALSNITICGGTLANLAFNIGRLHPLRQGPLIDWDLILVMEPSTILGALVGGYLNKLLPGWLTTTTLSVLLSFITYKMISKAFEIRRKERRALRHTLARLSATGPVGGAAAGSPPVAVPGATTVDGQPVGDEEAPLLAARGSWQMYAAASGDALLMDTPSPPSPVGPLTQRPSSGLSSSSGQAPAEEAAEQGRAGSQGGDESASAEGSDTNSAGGGSTPAAGRKQGVGGREDSAAALLRPGSALRKPLLPPAGPPGPAAAGGSEAKPASRSPIWQPHLPVGKFSVLVALLAGVVATDILKMQAACPSLDYWLRATAMVPITLATLFAVRAYLLRKGKEQRAAGYEHLEGDVEWTGKTTLLYPALCSFAGLCAGIFGVGGGIIKGPLMLEMGVLPEVAAATSATMILFTSMSASVVFISFGAVQWDYAALLFALGLVCTTVGQLLVLWVNRHVRSRSLLVFIIAAVLGISSVALAAQGGFATAAAARAHELWEFHDICGRAA